MANSNFTNPVGSVHWHELYGNHGKHRHTAALHDGNPYKSQLLSATNNQDMDALYERAIEWEADYTNRQLQLQENKAILEEQREYDSPLAQAQRMREAGINPDLEGASISSGSGSGSAQLANPGMADQQGQTSFSNAYDNTRLAFEGINTAANVLGTMTGGVTSIMQAVSTFKTLPSQLRLNEAAAGLQDAQATQIRELLGGQKEAISLSNAAQGIQNSSAILQQLATFASLISPDTEDFAPHLTALGVPQESIPAYTSMIKQMHANPQMRQQYAAAEVGAKWSEAENAKYTEEIVAGMTDLAYNIQYEQQYWEYHTAHLQRQIASLIDTQEYAQSSADVLSGGLMLTSASQAYDASAIALQRKQLTADTATFLDGLKSRAEALKKIDDRIQGIRRDVKARDGLYTANEAALIDRLEAEKIALRNLYSSQFNQIKTAYLNAAQQQYNYYYRLDSQGNLTPAAKLEVANMFSDATFNDLIYHTMTPGQIANMWTNTVIDAAGVAVDAVKPPVRIPMRPSR